MNNRIVLLISMFVYFMDDVREFFYALKRKINMPKIVAIYGSPRRKGNTATLLKRAVEGATEEGADVEEIVLRDLKMSPLNT